MFFLSPWPINLTFSSMRQSSLLRKTPILNRPGGEYSSGTCKLAQKNKETKTATTILVSPCPAPQKTVVEATRMSEWEGPMGESWFLSLASSVNVSHHFNFLVCKMVKIATLWLGGVKRDYANKGTLKMPGCPPHVTYHLLVMQTGGGVSKYLL